MMKPSEPSGPKPLEKGTIVHLNQMVLGESLGIKTFNKRGGEGEIIGVSTDAKGSVYQVRMYRNDRVRTARREDLTVHVKKTKKLRARERAERQRNKKR